jgi:hypothetical protein
MEDNERMRTPDASAIVVALSTLVAITTVSVVMSQLTPADRAGASLPLAPITATAEPVDSLDTLGLDPDESDPVQEPSSDNTSADPTPNPETTVVVPAPAEPVIEPEPDPEPEPEPSTAPGNSANAPGLGGANPGKGQGQGNENGKP